MQFCCVVYLLMVGLFVSLPVASYPYMLPYLAMFICVEVCLYSYLFPNLVMFICVDICEKMSLSLHVAIPFHVYLCRYLKKRRYPK